MLEDEKELAFGYWCEVKNNPIPWVELSHAERSKILAKAKRRLWWSKLPLCSKLDWRK